jgi:sensor histidine kinase YesM
MNIFSISTLTNKKNILNLLFLIGFAWILFAVTPDFYSFYKKDIRNLTHMYIVGMAMFFIHSRVLLPIKFEENNNRKYVTLLFSCLLIFTFLEVYLFLDIFKSLVNPANNIFGFVPGQLITLPSMMKITALACMPILVIILLSVVDAWLLYGFRCIAPYLEGLVHIVVLTMIFALFVTVPEIKSREISLILPLIMVFYANTFIITPILLREKKIIRYSVGMLTLISGYFLFQTVLLTVFAMPKFNPETGQVFTRADIGQIILSTPAIIILITTLFLSFVYAEVRIRVKSRERVLNIKLGTKESELKLLKSQVNPHFLFNTLNTLYATALNEKADKTSASIAKLANLLRYMQKDINRDFIPLENEIKYLEDYIAIQKLRCAIEPQVNTEFVNIENRLISPGLLIPFVENAFKYGIDPSKASELFISVVGDKERMVFTCENSYDDDYKSFHKEKGLGIGIENAEQRLELVYPKNHTFEITKKDNKFIVKIALTIPVAN